MILQLLKKWTKEQAINTIYADKIPNALEEVVLYWNTSIKLNDYLVNEAMEAYFQNDTNKEFPNISGIQFANRTSSVTVNNVTYPVPVYNADGSVKEGNEVLSIKIKDVDPKAIWNFAFSVAALCIIILMLSILLNLIMYLILVLNMLPKHL